MDRQQNSQDADAQTLTGPAASSLASEEAPLSVACPTIDELPALAARRTAEVAEVNFDELYRTQRGRVLATVRSVLGPSDEIEDVVQLVFIEVHRSLGRFQGRSMLSTWIYRIAVNVTLQHIRRKKRRRWLLLVVLLQVLLVAGVQDVRGGLHHQVVQDLECLGARC